MEKVDSIISIITRLLYLVVTLSLVAYPLPANAHLLNIDLTQSVAKVMLSGGESVDAHCASESGALKTHMHSKDGKSGDKSSSNCCSAMGCGFTFATVIEYVPSRLASSHKYEITNDHGIFRIFHGLNRPPSA